jgi:hypothetical protein
VNAGDCSRLLSPRDSPSRQSAGQGAQPQTHCMRSMLQLLEPPAACELQSLRGVCAGGKCPPGAHAPHCIPEQLQARPTLHLARFAGVTQRTLLNWLANVTTSKAPEGYTLPAFTWFIDQTIGGWVRWLPPRSAAPAVHAQPHCTGQPKLLTGCLTSGLIQDRRHCLLPIGCSA